MADVAEGTKQVVAVGEGSPPTQMEGVASKLRAKAVALGAAAAVAAGTPLGTPLGGQGGGPPLLQPAPARAVTFHDQASSPHEILHHALPLDGDVHDNPAVKVETMLGELNVPPARAAGGARSIRQANYAARSFEPAEARAVVARCQAALAERAAVLATVPAENRAAAGAKMDQLGGELRALAARLEGGRTIGADELRAAQEDLLVRVLQLEAEYLDVDHAGAIPPELAGRPILNGRATVDLDILMRSRVDATGGAPLERVTIMVDGANAPVTAGNFVDLVQKGFYHGMVSSITRGRAARGARRLTPPQVLPACRRLRRPDGRPEPGRRPGGPAAWLRAAGRGAPHPAGVRGEGRQPPDLQRDAGRHLAV